MVIKPSRFKVQKVAKKVVQRSDFIIFQVFTSTQLNEAEKSLSLMNHFIINSIQANSKEVYVCVLAGNRMKLVEPSRLRCGQSIMLDCLN